MASQPSADLYPVDLLRSGSFSLGLVLANSIRVDMSQSETILGMLQRRERVTPHWALETLTYRTWRQIIGRCHLPSNSSYAQYGARGIRVCERWRTFTNFFADMGERPSKDMTIDRIDNAKGYEPGNCRWATRTEQNNNKTTNHRITWNGETRTVAEWGRATGLGRRVIKDRITRYGWDVERALSSPLDPNKWKRLRST